MTPHTPQPDAPPLPAAFLRLPLAHRALHDRGEARPENSRAAIRAAVAAGYGIEIDVQPSSDGHAMVFHDATLDRLTAEEGAVNARTAAALGAIALKDGDGEGIPTLAEVLEIVDGTVPLLIEIKDQSGCLGPDLAGLEEAVARDLAAHGGTGYPGPVAVMSFNPASVAAMRRLAPQVPRGLVTAAFDAENWPDVPPGTRDRLRRIPDITATRAAFISHQGDDLARVVMLAASGLPVLCWTIRTPEQEEMARRVAANVTFEGYRPALPGTGA